MKNKICIYLCLCLLLAIWVSCSEDEPHVPGGEPSYIHLSVKASGTINEDVNGEDRVSEVRMMAFDQTGNAVYNGLLSFPDGFDNSSSAVKLKPGIYDFYFFANESVSSGFSSALAAVANASQLQSNAAFSGLAYAPDFHPDTTTGLGRFIMSACYKGIVVNQGGSEQNPEPLVLPTTKVELIRSLAKVEVVFRKKTPGITIPAGSYVSSVQLQDVAKSYSVPPRDSYYTGSFAVSNTIVPSGFDYSNDSIGAVVFYLPEFLNKASGTNFTKLSINNRTFPILTDHAKTGLAAQRRSVPALSDSSVIRNYHYIINAYMDIQGGVYLKTRVEPWIKSSYVYMFEGDHSIAIPPVVPTGPGVIIPTPCGKVEIRSTNEFLQQGLMGAYGDAVNWWDPNIQGPNIIKGQPPYYCEKKYGKGWRLINSCEMMAFLTLFDQTYRVWQSNTWQGIDSDLPLFSIPFRQQAQDLLGKLTGVDMSKYILTDTHGGDNFGSEKLGIIDDFFTPGDIMVTLNQFPNGWSYPSPPYQGIESWYPMEVVHQVKGYWYSGYLPYDDPANYDRILYQQFQRYSFSSTVSRCVRNVE